MLRKVINLKEGSKLTCGARARSVGAREIVGAAAGRTPGESVRSAGSDQRGGGVMMSRGEPDERSEHGRREAASGADSGRAGTVWADLGGSGPVWTSLGRSGPVRAG